MGNCWLQVVAFSRPLAISFIVLARSWICAAWMLHLQTLETLAWFGWNVLPETCAKIPLDLLLVIWQIIAFWGGSWAESSQSLWPAVFVAWISLNIFQTSCLPNMCLGSGLSSIPVVSVQQVVALGFSDLWELGVLYNFRPGHLDRPPDGGVVGWVSSSNSAVRMGCSPWKRIHLAKSKA